MDAASAPTSAVMLPPPGVGCLAAAARRKSPIVLFWSNIVTPIAELLVHLRPYLPDPPVSCWTPLGVRSTGGKDGYVRIPALVCTFAGSGVLTVTIHSFNRLAASLLTSST